MNELFADSGYWIALYNHNDRLHGVALLLSKKYFETRAPIITSEMVFVEVLNHFSKFGERVRRDVVSFISRLSFDPLITVIAQTSEQFRQAAAFYAQMDDKSWSLTDCASFLIMHEHDIREALTYDKHFEQAGFKALLRSH
jgi:predicted nucleic acid-binding protein